MGCEQCKLLDASESESHENVIANVTAAEHSADQCDTAIKEDANNATTLTQSVNQFSNLAATENGVSTMEPSAPEHLQGDSTIAPIRSLIELGDIDSNILDSTERLEVHDEVADLSQSPNSTVPEDAVGSSELVTEESLSQQEVVSEPDNSRQSITEEEVNEDNSESETVVRKRRGTVRVNSIRGHKVCHLTYHFSCFRMIFYGFLSDI